METIPESLLERDAQDRARDRTHRDPFGGSGTGLSGLATLHTKVYRKDYGHPDLPDICRRAKGATR